MALMALLPLFDSATVDRSGLRHFFDNEFGPAGRCGFLTLYERFLAKGAPGMTAVMTGRTTPARAPCWQPAGPSCPVWPSA